MLDPVILMISIASVAIVALAGAAAKLRDPSAFAASLAGYRLLPAFAVRPVSYAIPVLEAVGAAGLLCAPTRTASALVLASLFAVFGLALLVNIARGNTEIDCGCSGFAGTARSLRRDMPQRIGAWHVARAAALAAIAAAALVTASPRVLVWFDYLSAGAGTLFTVAAWLTLDVLLTNLPKLDSLRNS
jgi:hypothetical protein